MLGVLEMAHVPMKQSELITVAMSRGSTPPKGFLYNLSTVFVSLFLEASHSYTVFPFLHHISLCAVGYSAYFLTRPIWFSRRQGQAQWFDPDHPTMYRTNQHGGAQRHSGLPTEYSQVKTQLCCKGCTSSTCQKY